MKQALPSNVREWVRVTASTRKDGSRVYTAKIARSDTDSTDYVGRRDTHEEAARIGAEYLAQPEGQRVKPPRKVFHNSVPRPEHRATHRPPRKVRDGTMRYDVTGRSGDRYCINVGIFLTRAEAEEAAAKFNLDGTTSHAKKPPKPKMAYACPKKKKPAPFVPTPQAKNTRALSWSDALSRVNGMQGSAKEIDATLRSRIQERRRA